MKKYSFIVTLIVITVFAACSRKSSPAKVVLTTYNTDILPLMQSKCAPCHLPSKGGNKANFENYESAKKHSADMLVRVMKNPGERGFMPMRNDKLSAEEIAIIKKWIDNGLLEK
jgi:mono/diheme cytochrome c family protein